MNMDEISMLCNKLNLDDGDGPVTRMNKSIYEKRKTRMDLCLVGRVMTNKLANRDALERVMKVAWGLSKRVKVESLVVNNISLHFCCTKDRQRILMGNHGRLNDKFFH